MSVTNLTTAVVYATLSAAMNASGAGDTQGLTPGLYVEDFPLITHSLTIEGLGGLAQLEPPRPCPPTAARCSPSRAMPTPTSR